MTEQLYVATDADGVQRADDLEIVWHLPGADGAQGATTTGGGTVVLRTADAMLEELGERIFTAEVVGDAAEGGRGILHVHGGRLVVETAWGIERAAEFALDCAEHVIGDARDAVLPGGTTLGAVVDEAREVLHRSSEQVEGRLGTVARLSAARRLRRQGAVLGDVAVGALQDDLARDLDALDDPAWATLASARDAVLGAVEAVRHLALPRYVTARERAYVDAEESTDGSPPVASGMLLTPWGPITLGAEHQPGYAPAWVAARDAAARARDAVRAREGEAGATAERAWQTGRLVELMA